MDNKGICEMDGDSKTVFVASITRNSCSLRNNLYDIITRDVVEPIISNTEEQDICNFKPKNDKFYVPKKKSKLKVKTVRDIRILYEKDIFETLPHELERQQKLLLRKIRDGFAKDENTRSIALNLLKSDKPVSRSSWQMLVNLNPEGHNHSSQYILWNGKCILVSGSKGGKCKFLCNYDIFKHKESFRKTSEIKNKALKKKRDLLRDSLNIRFKPGPLRKKKELDCSYQKYHVGEIKLVNLPQPGLDIQPSYGKALEPTITTFLQNLREKDGTISEKWAEFAVSMLGKITNKEVQIGTDNCVTFNLNYKCDQKLLLMRHDIHNGQNTTNNNIYDSKMEPFTLIDEPIIMSEVKNIVDQMLNTVEISLNQDSMYSGVDEPREIVNNVICNYTTGHTKDKAKRKYGELDRLDVTVIRLSENAKKLKSESCRELFCSLGCVCNSLESRYNLKDHCGRIDCMFGCKCDFSKYKITDSLESDCSEYLPGLLYLDKKINNNLAKEEQKFHQTVIVTDDKSILLKSKRRNWKTSKKYADFYSSLCLRNEIKNQKTLSVVLTKLKCENVEPWCMIHNLYKCFCKGKFTHSISHDLTNTEQVTINNSVNKDKEVAVVEEKRQSDSEIKKFVLEIPKSDVNKTVVEHEELASSYSTCARVVPFEGRKYSNGYYLRTNEKILEMEKNDKKLQAKMLNLMGQSVVNDQKDEPLTQKNIIDVANEPFKLDELLNNILQEQENLMRSMHSEHEEPKLTTAIENIEMKGLPNKMKLVKWLESSYKKYKERIDKGIWKTSLYPPRLGKVALYPWDFILSRYQERKNLFLVSLKKPFRIFMAVDARHPFFDHCINVRHIPQSDIDEYPIMVRSLINNSQNLNNFCILCGLSHCWELIGSVTKLNENKLIQSDLKNVATSSLDKRSYDKDSVFSKDDRYIFEENIGSTISIHDLNENNSSELSKWFVMTMENDFSEIQFYKRGFFVKYESIVKAIQVARRVGKTVRLSSQKCNDGTSGPHFGIYATPNTNENSVFVGPYENDEPLGIETIKNPIAILSQKKTRGLWITINKIDNSKVIDNPLSFMPSYKKDWDSAVTLENDTDSELNKSEDQSSSTENTDLSDESANPVKLPINNTSQIKKFVKPIKISRKDGFYHLTSNSLLKSFNLNKCTQINKGIPQKVVLAPSGTSLLNKYVMSRLTDIPQISNPEAKNKTLFNKPVAEIAPQIKITNIASLCPTSSKSSKSKSEGGMLVLKPEEINERLANNYFHIMQPLEGNNIKINTELLKAQPDQDVEEFLDSSIIFTAPATDVYVISDDEDYSSNTPIVSTWKNVWISCTNIKSIGWISGKRNNENKVSFEFPGFAFTDYYEEEEAFNKINEVFSRKVYVPKNIKMEWQVIENKEELNSDHKLRLEDLRRDYMLTERGLVKINRLVIDVNKRVNDDNGDSPSPQAVASTSLECENVSMIIDEQNLEGF
ncbi:unnamed protein product [Parnassius apollo]|uniref:(apollo) hypothetical protein n=1 Tax=Parnassius apollo TaxID=110799 RepID=A0A8S3WJV8_PARAO|nr:unnamed protein product [Parnassius apollo]